MKIICISGKAQAGKDTTAKIMRTKLHDKGYKVLITHYADYLKFICANMFGWNGEKDIEGRTLLQYVGTDIVRNKDANFWVDSLIRLLRIFEGEWDYVLIPDTRFPNEIECVSKIFDTKSVRVESSRITKNNGGLTDSQTNHPSECALDNYGFNFVINNDGSLEELENKVLDLVSKL